MEVLPETAGSMLITMVLSILQVYLENVPDVPTLQTRVNLFSVIVVPDRGYNTCFSLHDVKFRLEGETLAPGICTGI